MRPMNNRDQRDRKPSGLAAVRVLLMAVFAALWPLYKGSSVTMVMYAGVLCLMGARLCEDIGGMLVKDQMKMRIVRNLERGFFLFLFPLVGLAILNFCYPAVQNEDSADVAGKSQAFEEAAETETAGNSPVSEKYVYHRVTEDPDNPYVDAVDYTNAEEFMQNRTISPQVLYEDEDYRLEVTGYSFENNILLLHTAFTNHTDQTVRACTESFSLYANSFDTTQLIYVGSPQNLGTDVHAGEKAESEIKISPRAVPFYDPFLEKVEFRLDVRASDTIGSKSNNDLLLETDPIVLYTEAADGENADFDVLSASGVKLLYDSEEVRVIRTEIKGFLADERKPDNRLSTGWKILVENRTDHDMLADHRSCTVNGWKALSDLYDEDYVETDEPEEGLLNEYWEVEENRLPKIIPAGKRREIRFILDRPKGFDPQEEPAEDESETPDESDEKISLEGWPLDEIKTASAGFDIHFTDAAGEKRSVHIEDTFTGTEEQADTGK